jgi:hypothetical protein
MGLAARARPRRRGLTGEPPLFHLLSDLGESQSVFLVDLDGPRCRTVSVQVMGVSKLGPRP